jgi:hypothetical protein
VFDYARTPPEPPEGLVLMVVLAVMKIMGADLWARFGASSTDFAVKTVKQRLNSGLVVRF